MKRFFTGVFVFLALFLLIGCGEESKNQNKNAEVSITANESQNIDKYIALKDEYDKSISSIAKEINEYLNNHADFKDANELISKAKNLEDKIKKTIVDVNEAKGITSSDLKEQLIKCLKLEETRIDGLYMGMKKNKEGGEFLSDFKRGGDAAESFEKENRNLSNMIASLSKTSKNNNKNNSSENDYEPTNSPELAKDPNEIPLKIDLPNSNGTRYKMGKLVTPLNSSRPTSHQETKITSPYGAGHEIIVELNPINGGYMEIYVHVPYEGVNGLEWSSRRVLAENYERVTVFAVPIYNWTSNSDNGSLFEVVPIVRLDDKYHTTGLFILSNNQNGNYQTSHFSSLQQANGIIKASVDTSGSGKLHLQSNGIGCTMVYSATYRCIDFE